MRVMIFIEGTTFYTRPLLFLFSKHGYKPIKNAVKTVNALYDKGHEIYLCSYVRKNRCDFIKSIIDFFGMRYTEIVCRDKGEKYRKIVERLRPDILIDDDCKSIGGLKECCITDVEEEKNDFAFVAIANDIVMVILIHLQFFKISGSRYGKSNA